MNGYLLRLTMRTGASGPGQTMQPSVRSTSPVAEWEPRIDRIGMEEFEAGESPLAPLASEAGVEQDDALPAPGLSSIPTASPPESVTVQRQMAMAPPRADHDMAPLPSIAIARQKITDDLMPSSTPTHLSEPTGAPQGAVAWSDSPMTGEPPEVIGTPTVSPELNDGAEVEGSVASRDGRRMQALRPSTTQTREAVRYVSRVGVRDDPAPGVRPIETARLDPAIRTLAEQSGPMPADASIRAPAPDTGPSIVIGRLNVEVAPQETAPPSAANPRPGPLTAAAVSIIGPLRGGVRPDLYFSLRHR